MEYCDLYFCLSAGVSAHISQKPHVYTSQTITNFSVDVTCGHCSVLLWWQHNTLCATSFVDDILFSHNGAIGPESMMTHIFLPDWKWQPQSDVVGRVCQVVAPGAKFAIICWCQCLVLDFCCCLGNWRGIWRM